MDLGYYIIPLFKKEPVYPRDAYRKLSPSFPHFCSLCTQEIKQIQDQGTYGLFPFLWKGGQGIQEDHVDIKDI